jgi:hypothetical protein
LSPWLSSEPFDAIVAKKAKKEQEKITGESGLDAPLLPFKPHPFL